MSAAPRISDAEWTVMNVLWTRGPSSLAEVVREIEGRLHWKPRTVQSLIRRLVDKRRRSSVAMWRARLRRADLGLESPSYENRRWVSRLEGFGCQHERDCPQYRNRSAHCFDA